MKYVFAGLIVLVVFLVGCVSRQDEAYELISGQIPGSYRVVFTNEQQAVKAMERLSKALHARLGPDERAQGVQLRPRFLRWRQDDDHLRIDLYLDDLSKQRYEKGTGFRLSLAAIDDIGNRIGNGFMNPKPGEWRYDVFHDSRVMGAWTGWHWGVTKKDVAKRIKEPQESEWELIEDQLAWARVHGTTRREALKRWEAWHAAHPEWNPYAFTTNRLTILDGDPGTDDFAAMLVLAKEGNRCERFPGACVATYGNAPVETTLRNMTLGAWYLGASPILVRGAAEPSSGGRWQVADGRFHGSDAMGGVSQGLVRRFQLTEARFKRCTHTLDDLIYLIKNADDVTYIATGPLTTLAQLLAREPEVATRIKRLYVIGGDIAKSDSSVASPQGDGLNFLADGAAVQRVFASGLDITLFPSALARSRAQLAGKDIDALEALGKSSVAVKCFRQNLRSNVMASNTTASNTTALNAEVPDAAILHDTLPVLYALYPDKFTIVDMRLAVNGLGHLFETPEGRLVHVATDMDPPLLFHSISNGVRKCFEPRLDP